MHTARCIPLVQRNRTATLIHIFSCYGLPVLAAFLITDSHVSAVWHFAIELRLTFIDLSTTHKLKLRV